MVGAELPGHERRQDGGAGYERSDDLGGTPAERVAAHEPPDDPEQTGARKQEPGEIEAGRRAMGLT